MSRDYWENRYQTNETSWDKGEPAPGLADFLASHTDLTKGTVAIPGCGMGHDVREFARHGFAAFGFDLAPSAIRLAEEKTRACPGLTARFALADFLRDEPPQKFDWLFEHTLFCAIKPEERDDYVRAVLRWLKPGGYYLALNYFLCEQKEPPWPTSREEQCRRFSPHFELLADWLPRSYPNRTGRERMFHWRSLRTATIA